MANQQHIQMHVLYLNKPLAINYSGFENITKQAFNHDVLNGYPNSFIPQKKQVTSGRSFFGYRSTGIRTYIQHSDVVVVYGHYLFAFWIGFFYCKLYRKKLVLTTDATDKAGTAESKGVKLFFKKRFLRFLYHSLADLVFVPSTAAKEFLLSQKISEPKIIVTPYVVDEDFIQTIAAQTNTQLFREHLSITEQAVVFIFCAKFIERKRPLDAIKAFSKLKNHHSFLIMIGDGPLKDAIQSTIQSLDLHDKVLLPGLVNYTELPKWYTASDVLIFCSEHEPYGLPVNEAMLCGIPVIVSDKIGARLDLVEEGITGWEYTTGNTDALADAMQYAADNPQLLKKMGKAAKEKMKTWSSEENVARQLNVFKAKGWLV